VKEGKYDGLILYSCMKREQWKCWNCSKKGEARMRENDGGVNLIKIYCKHTCKCYNVSPTYICFIFISKY
jgi:hypothetical protein